MRSTDTALFYFRLQFNGRYRINEKHRRAALQNYEDENEASSVVVNDYHHHQSLPRCISIYRTDSWNLLIKLCVPLCSLWIIFRRHSGDFLNLEDIYQRRRKKSRFNRHLLLWRLMTRVRVGNCHCLVEAVVTDRPTDRESAFLAVFFEATQAAHLTLAISVTVSVSVRVRKGNIIFSSSHLSATSEESRKYNWTFEAGEAHTLIGHGTLTATSGSV